MNFPKPFIPRQPGSLKLATVALVTACGGNANAAQIIEAMGVREKCSTSQIHRYGAPINTKDGFECYMPADIVAALESHCGQPIISRHLALQTSNVLISGEPGDGEAVTQHLASISQEFGRVMAIIGASLADGKIEPEEAGRILGAIQEELNALSRLYSDLAKLQRENS